MHRPPVLRRLAAAAVLACLAVPPPVAAASRPALAGTVVLSGSRTSYAAVRLTRAVRIGDPLTNRAYAGTVAVTGEDRFAGFLLLADRPRFDGVGVVGGALPQAAGPRSFVHPTHGLDPEATEWTLPAGDYRLYLLAHGKPTTVTLRLRGLTGRTALRPSRATRKAVLAAPAATVSTAPAGLLYSAGADLAVTGPALFLSFAYLLHTLPHAQSAYVGCEYYTPPDTGPLAYAPGCPSPLDDRGMPVFVYSVESPAETLKFVVTAGTPTSSWEGGSGATWATATPAAAAGYFHFWTTL